MNTNPISRLRHLSSVTVHEMNYASRRLFELQRVQTTAPLDEVVATVLCLVDA
jgi:hypothetical protein